MAIAPPPTERIVWIDAARGVAIVLVGSSSGGERTVRARTAVLPRAVLLHRSSQTWLNRQLL